MKSPNLLAMNNKVRGHTRRKNNQGGGGRGEGEEREGEEREIKRQRVRISLGLREDQSQVSPVNASRNASSKRHMVK